jgi:large subunit ribosomal protein L19e|tara:strand:- start:1332 stop:1736 length:405 start_codon:yes stop_codon:yes gene_type:complete
MNLSKKKELATRTLKVGKKRIVFLESRINEIKEAITKQDIRDLKDNGAIIVNEIKGRKKNIKKKRKRSDGKIKKKVKKRKQEYVILTRKLRDYISKMKNQENVSKEKYYDVRKKIRNRFFRSKSHLKQYVEAGK